MNALAPSEFLAQVQHYFAEELKLVRGQQSLWRCFDCKRVIPRDELPMRCEECSGPPLERKLGKFRKATRKIPQDAMVCKRCVDRHDHLKTMVLNLQVDALQRGLEKRAMLKTFANNPTKYLRRAAQSDAN